MTISAKVPKDVSAIKKKLIFNLTKRQIISFLLAGVAGFSAYGFLKNYMETDMAALVMTGVMMPFLFVGIYEKDGYPAEKIAYFMIRRAFLLPGIRPYKAENFYDMQNISEQQEKNRKEKMKGGKQRIGKKQKQKQE